jgi:hypothetical protein
LSPGLKIDLEFGTQTIPEIGHNVLVDSETTMSDDRGVGIERFDGNNFHIWKFSLLTMVKLKELTSILDGSETRPLTDEVKMREWDRKQTQLEAMIVTSMKGEQLKPIVNCRSATEMWARLLSIHEQRTETSESVLLGEFYGYRMDPRKTLTENISRLEEIISKLEACNHKLPDRSIATRIVTALPKSYSHFACTWNALTPDRQTKDNLVGLLLQEEQRMTSGSQDQEGIAFHLKTKKGGSRGDLKKEIVCYKCNKKGHFARECRMSTKENSKQHKPWKPKSESALADSILTAERSQEWIIDSGATQHMTNDKNLLEEFQEVNNHGVTLADKSIAQVTGRGKITLQPSSGGGLVRLEEVLLIPSLSKNLFSIPEPQIMVGPLYLKRTK